MTTLACPNGCGDLTVFLAVRSRRQRPYTGCLVCGFADWRGGNTAVDLQCADPLPAIDPPVEYEVVDSVIGSDPYA